MRSPNPFIKIDENPAVPLELKAQVMDSVKLTSLLMEFTELFVTKQVDSFIGLWKA